MNPKRGGIGRFYGIGVGPGDPELLTLRAHRILTEVPVIFVPQKDEQSGSFARSIIANLVDGSKVTGLVFPMLRDERRLSCYWQKAADVIWQHLEKGQDCALVNVGDPLLYGTFVHVLEALRKNHPQVEVEVVPGVSSITAAAASAVAPLAVNDEKIAIISGNEEAETIRDTLNKFDTVVFLKVHRVFDRLLGILEEMNLLEKCVYVRRCTTRDEEIIRDVRNLKGKRLDYFSLLILRR
ncbi:MAG: precorrin-2 C(20)-methyltransferase [Chloroflexota bacterium]|nr:precorrin-2 C(20)-methyltransferase [Chloroflexota bacterium]